MKQFFKKLYLFTGIVVVLNLLYLFLLLRLSPGFKKIAEISNFENKRFDLIVVGKGMAFVGLDAEYLTNKGISTCNFSVAGNHVFTSLFLLEDYLKKNTKPKMVVLGLSSAIGKSYLHPVRFFNPEVEFFCHPNFFSNITNPPMLNFQWLAVDLLKIAISNDYRNATMVLGQWKTKKVIPDGGAYKNDSSKSIDYRNPFLLEIIALCQKNGIKPVIMELPGLNCNQNNLTFQYIAKLKDGTKQMVYNFNNNAIASQVLNPVTD